MQPLFRESMTRRELLPTTAQLLHRRNTSTISGCIDLNHGLPIPLFRTQCEWTPLDVRRLPALQGVSLISSCLAGRMPGHQHLEVQLTSPKCTDNCVADSCGRRQAVFMSRTRAIQELCRNFSSEACTPKPLATWSRGAAGHRCVAICLNGQDAPPQYRMAVSREFAGQIGQQ
jgi:hypothetical protein